jgi:pyruvate dehydrogenase E2 component (dihydrolipoamide acetyltransferase)
MSVSVTMPRLGESVTEGTVTRWLKKEGDQVAVDEPLLEVSTDKVDTEIPSPVAGILSKITVAEDETVEVGSELAVIDDGSASAAPTTEQPATEQTTTQPDAEVPAPSAAAASAPAASAPAEPVASAPSAPPAPLAPPAPTPVPPPAPAPALVSAAPDSAAPVSAVPALAAAPAVTVLPVQSQDDGGGDPSYVTPLVRKLATEHGVDLGALSGTGVGGRIRKQDVLAAAEAARVAKAAAASNGSAGATRQAAPAGTASPAAAALRGRTEKMSRLRGVLAARLVESLQTAAQLTTVVEVDITRVARLREATKAEFEAREGVKLSFLPFFALAAVEALKQHPVMNASIDTAAGTITYHDAEHLGIAVDTERGLLVPVVHDAGDLNLGGLARKIADVAHRTRTNQVNPDELSGGTFTLTNTGSRGALFDTPILLPPQVGILGTGAVVKRPVVIDDADLGETISVRSMVYLALTYDHRLVDGGDAARFLGTIKARLEEGRFEADLGL